MPERDALNHTFPAVSIEARGSTALEWPLGDAKRGRMRGGYTFRVDPGNTIAELDDENNDHAVRGSTLLRVVWSCGWVSFCVTGNYTLGGRNTWTPHLEVYVNGGHSTRTIANWTASEIETTWDEPSDNWCLGGGYVTDWFEVTGDENVFVRRWVGLDIVSHGYRWLEGGGDTLTASNNFGGVALVPQDIEGGCLVQGVCPKQWGGGGGSACMSSSCLLLDNEAGYHHSGNLYVSGDEINGSATGARPTSCIRQNRSNSRITL